MKNFFRTALALAIISIIMFPAVSSAGWDVASLTGHGLPSASISAIILNILDWLLMMFGIVGIIGFLISGTMYLLAAGDDALIERAKEGMKYSIIGVLVGLAGLVAIGAIDAILNAGSNGII